MFWKYLFLLGFVFVLTYDPKSRTLEHLITQNAPCKDGHYQEVQFAEKGYARPQNNKTYMGAIIST
jgi:hypothetical protein